MTSQEEEIRSQVGAKSPPITRGRVLLVALAITAALALVIPLGLGALPQTLQIPALFLACALIAVVAMIMPASLRTKVAPLVAAFVASAGVLPLFVRAPEEANEQSSPKADPQYLAELVERGPFTENLPEPLVAEGLRPVRIGDVSAASKLGSAELVVGPDLGELDGFFGHIEVYPSEEEAANRATAYMDELVERYPPGTGTPESFCVWDDLGSFWTCAGSRGYVYAEVTVSPGANAFRPYATDSVDALLRYGDRMTRLATNT
jgi:hypothetical protein